MRSLSLLRCNLTPLVVALTVLLAAAATGATLSGTISGRLTKAGSPYTITGDLRVPLADTLRIDAGVEMRFSASSSFVIEGRMVAEGTEQDTIRFTSNAGPAAAPGDWNGIFVGNTAACRLSGCIVSYAATGITCDGSAPVIEFSILGYNNNAVDCVNGSLAHVRFSFLFGNENAAIRCIDSDPLIELNEITGNALTGFESALVCNGANPRIQRNLIHANGNSGIDCTHGAAPHIYQNTLADNGFGITISDSDPVLYDNLITGSSTGISCENGAPEIAYNNVFGNYEGDFINCPTGIGELTALNFNNHPSDASANVSLDPLYLDAAQGDFRIRDDSPCVNAGHPANPAGIAYSGPRPDIGFTEIGDGTSGVDRDAAQLPYTHRLSQNYPNPFNPSTTIQYEISGGTELPVRLSICNETGQVVRELVNGWQAPGTHRVVWGADDDAGRRVASGAYVYRLEVNGEVRSRRMLLVR